VAAGKGGWRAAPRLFGNGRDLLGMQRHGHGPPSG
jgi:hypothetical protein